jgi:hypothetical protein
VDLANLPSRARWFAKADAALEILAMVRDAMSPPVVEGFFIGRIYSNLPCPDRCRNG